MEEKETVLALRPYLEEVRFYCERLSDEELCDFICKIAQEAPPKKRGDFLDKLRKHSGGEATTHIKAKYDLVSRVENLMDEIQLRQEAIEDGSFYGEDYDGYDGRYDYYDEEGPDAISKEQIEEFETLFAESDHLFLSGGLKDAEEAYRVLLEMFRGDSEDVALLYDISDCEPNVDWRETRARFCRCVYENAAPKERVRKMLHAMEIGVRMFESRYAPSEEKYPLLQDVADAKTGEMKGWKTFLKNWKGELKKEGGNRAFILFLEAIHFLDGTDGVAAAVRKEKVPVGYLFWLDKLLSQERWEDAADIAQETLAALPNGGLRSQAAEILSLAGKHIKDDALVLKGRREQFASAPKDSELVSLIEEAERQELKTEELKQALKLLGTTESKAKFRVKILLMLGEMDKAFKIVEKEKAIGWSGDSTGTGLFFGAMMTALAHGDPKAAIIRALLRRYVENRRGRYSYYHGGFEDDGKKAVHDRIFQEITDGIGNLSVTKAKRKKWFSFAEKLGGERIDGIVSNKHRNAYARAAGVLGSLMEYAILSGDAEKAKELLHTYRDEKYSRYSAFRREFDTVMDNSDLLKSLGPRRR